MGLQLVTRRGCHLCEDAERILAARGVGFTAVDVDQDAELSRLYDFRVPVLLQDGKPVAEGRLDEAAIERALGRVQAVLIQRAGPESALEVHRVTQLAFGGYGWLTPPSGALAETEDDVRRDLQQHGGALARMAGSAVGALRLRAEPKRDRELQRLRCSPPRSLYPARIR